MAKVFLGVGHGGDDPGTTGYLKEADVNLAMAIACRDYLQSQGIMVKMSRIQDENDPVGEEIRECNAYHPDLAIDIHNNAGGGKGFECYYHYKGGISKKLAANIEDEIKAIGQNSRGIKTRLNASGSDYYAFIRQTNCPSVICEGVFVDNAADAARADTPGEQKAFGIAYAKGILRTLGIGEREGGSAVYFPKYTGNSVSIVEALQSVGAKSSYSKRVETAAKNGIANYKGTASQNTKMLALLKQGKLIR